MNYTCNEFGKTSLFLNNIDVYGMDRAIHGMRNPLNSWDKSDSKFITDKFGTPQYTLGPKDLDLAKRLIKAGPEHRKFLRQIVIWTEITAPTYWWLQFDTYKVGVSGNSTSKMHKLLAKEFELKDFSYFVDSHSRLTKVVDELNELRENYLKETDVNKAKDIWYAILQLLPMSYRQMRTVTMNYENAYTMFRQRKDHNLNEWHEFCNYLTCLPYFKEFFLEDE